MMITGGGVYRVLEPVPVITSALADAGWSTARLPAPETIKELYAGLASALGFPRYFGHNLDALWDCLTDLTGPTALIMEELDAAGRGRTGALAVDHGRAERAD